MEEKPQLTELEKTEELQKKFELERDEHTAKITKLIKLIGDLTTISDAQVLMYSYKHEYVDKITKYRPILYRKKSKDAEFKKSRFEFYKTKHDVRLDYKELNEYINADMALRIRQTELVDNQIKYFEECLDTVNQLGFAIKNKISIEEFIFKNK